MGHRLSLSVAELCQPTVTVPVIRGEGNICPAYLAKQCEELCGSIFETQQSSHRPGIALVIRMKFTANQR
jgi:hypothetical protein